MKEILSLNLKIAIAFAIFYLVYKLFLSSDTFFVRNRFYLLGAMLVSLISPLLKFKILEPVPEANVLSFANVEVSPVQQLPESGINYWPIVTKVAMGLYLAGVLIYLIRLLWAYNKVIRLILKSEQKKLQGLILVITRLSVSPFSLLKWLVIPSSQLDHPDFENIVQHESIHSRQYHSVDLFLAELLVVFQWFNPFAWWLKKSMVENHEFIVDQVVLRNGIDQRKYQYSLLNLSTGNGQFAVVNYFNANLLKKRIRMMNKNNSPKWYGIKNVMVLISATIVVALTASFEPKVLAQKTDSEPTVFIDGKKSDMKSLNNINPSNISSVNVLKDSMALSKYGKDGKKGVIEVITKDSRSISNTDKPITYESTEIELHESHLDSLKTAEFEGSFFNKNSLIFLDGKKISREEFRKISHSIKKMDVYKGEAAVAKYGKEGKDGVVVVITKDTPNTGKSGLLTMEEVKVVGYGVNKDSLNSPKGFSFRSDGLNKIPLIFLDGKKITQDELTKIDASTISRVEVLKGDAAKLVYGEKGKDGVVLVTSKSPQNHPNVTPQ